MKIDSTLAREIRRQANGDGSREAKSAFLRKARAACAMMSTPDVMHGKFNEAIQTYGRVPVAVCIAATLYATRDRIDYWGYGWARAVLNTWTNRTEGNIVTVLIRDGLHPTRICDYARSFIRATTETEME